MDSIINKYGNIHITFSEDSPEHQKFFTYLVNSIVSKNKKWVNNFKDLDDIIQSYTNPYDTIILNFNTGVIHNTTLVFQL